MYVSINGIGKNRGVYIQQSYRKPNEKTSSRIIRSLGRYNALLQRFDGDEKKDDGVGSCRNRHRYEGIQGKDQKYLGYAKILSPSSKRSSYEYCKTLLEPPKYSLDQVCRSLSVMSGESDLIQEEFYKNSNFIHPRNTRILYYDCTNYYFEIESESEIMKYGKGDVREILKINQRRWEIEVVSWSIVCLSRS